MVAEDASWVLDFSCGENPDPVFSPEVSRSWRLSCCPPGLAMTPCYFAQKKHGRFKILNLDVVSHTCKVRLSSLIIWNREVEYTTGVMDEVH